MERLIIWGVLELEDEHNMGAAESPYRKVLLNATYISLQGGRLIGGWEDNPFKGELQVVLRGNHSTPEWALPEGPDQGSKVLGVFGELDLHGIPHSIYKTKLSETAEAGSKVLSLMDFVDCQVNRGTNTVLQNNVVAGFGRVGYRIDSEPCSSQFNPLEKWFDNEAHGGLYGIYMNRDGLPGCSLVQGFTVWTCWDYEIYFQTTASVHIYNVTLVDNGMAISSMIYMPAAVSHKISSKRVEIKSSLIVGSSPEFNCSDVLTNDDPNIELSAAHRSSRLPSGIIRDPTCKYILEWQSYQCFGMEYAMMVIKSLDADTETRRLSPVAIVSNGYVDLINEQFLPNLNSTVFGENYFDRTYQMLYLLVKGNIPVEIHTTAVIFVSFQLPAVTEDDFYSSQNLVRNLALFLKIPGDKIRVSQITRGENLRRERSTGLTAELEIGDPPAQFISSDATGQMQLYELQEIAGSLGQAVILGKSSSILGCNISSMSINNPIPSPSDSAWIKVTAQPVERLAFPVRHMAFVSLLSVITQPVAEKTGQPFSQQPSVKAVDSDGNCVSVGITSLTSKVILKDTNNNQISGLSGNTIPFSSCWANYTDLTPLRTGTCTISFSHL
ncbi:hypothetical protein MC885_002177 [Smutsia gigantea]|nr:hypothetical protein MC885_002177 [Smutsia gigantea]